MYSCQYLHFHYRTTGFHICNSLLWQRKPGSHYLLLYFPYLINPPLCNQSSIATAISSSVKMLSLPHLGFDILSYSHWSMWTPFSAVGVWHPSARLRLICGCPLHPTQVWTLCTGPHPCTQTLLTPFGLLGASPPVPVQVPCSPCLLSETGAPPGIDVLFTMLRLWLFMLGHHLLGYPLHASQTVTLQAT